MNKQQIELTKELGATFAFDHAIGDLVTFSNGSFALLAVSYQPETHNLGFMFFQKLNSPFVYRACIRRNGFVSKPAKYFNFTIKNDLTTLISNLEFRGAIINPEFTIVD